MRGRLVWRHGLRRPGRAGRVLRERSFIISARRARCSHHHVPSPGRWPDRLMIFRIRKRPFARCDMEANLNRGGNDIH